LAELKRIVSFLIATLKMEHILQKDTIATRRKVLHRLQKTSVETSVDSLDNFYDAFSKRIKKVDKPGRGMKAIQWVLFARTPLTLEELRYAVSIDHDKATFNPKEDLAPPSFLEYTSGLLEVVGKTVTFCHGTAESRFRSRAQDYFDTPLPQGYLADCCLNYLSLESVGPEYCDKDDTDLPPFFPYARDEGLYHLIPQCHESCPQKLLEWVQHSYVQALFRPLGTNEVISSSMQRSKRRVSRAIFAVMAALFDRHPDKDHINVFCSGNSILPFFYTN
jgi:hypothetical protein